MSDFEFEKWAQEYELEEGTVKHLVDLGFKSYKSLSKLTEEACRKLFSKIISLGQYVLLEAGLELLRPAAGHTSMNTPPPEQTPAPKTAAPEPHTAVLTPASVQDATGLAQLLHSLPQLQTTRQDLISGEVATDPFCFGTGPYAAKKLRLVNDYISNSLDLVHSHRNTVTVGGVEVEVAKAKTVTNDKIHVAQYMEGALRILREMILDEALTPQQTLNHVNYLIQVACLAQAHQWQRVLIYDATYRKEQHRHGFQWGTTSAFLLNSHLNAPRHVEMRNRNNNASPTNPQTGKTICLSWNGRAGCHRTNCQFDHVCKVCYSKAHNQVGHASRHNSEGKKLSRPNPTSPPNNK